MAPWVVSSWSGGFSCSGLKLHCSQLSALLFCQTSLPPWQNWETGPVARTSTGPDYGSALPVAEGGFALLGWDVPWGCQGVVTSASASVRESSEWCSWK